MRLQGVRSTVQEWQDAREIERLRLAETTLRESLAKADRKALADHEELTAAHQQIRALSDRLEVLEGTEHPDSVRAARARQEAMRALRRLDDMRGRLAAAEDALRVARTAGAAPRQPLAIAGPRHAAPSSAGTADTTGPTTEDELGVEADWFHGKAMETARREAAAALLLSETAVVLAGAHQHTEPGPGDTEDTGTSCALCEITDRITAHLDQRAALSVPENGA